MKLRVRAKFSLYVGLLAVALVAAVVGTRIIKYSHGSVTGLRSALYEAVEHGDTSSVRLLLLVGADPSWINQGIGMSALDGAAYQGNVKIARMLLRAGADPDGGGEMFRRAMFRAASRQDREMVGLLLEHGARYELVDALLLGDTDTIDKALSENPNALEDTRYHDGSSLLYMALEEKRLDTARYLLDHGLSPTEEGSGGVGMESVLDTARKRTYTDEFVELFESYSSAV